MTFVVQTRPERFEIRESRATPSGPRSRTLATFKELSDEVIAQARERAAKPPSPANLRSAARRMGAPVKQEPADQAARQLIAELGRGRQPEPKLQRLLTAKLADSSTDATRPADPARAVAEWMASTPRERGKALVDLLLMADALPSGSRHGKPLRFPRLDSTPA